MLHFVTRTHVMGAEGIAQVLQHWPSKQRTRSSNSSTSGRKKKNVLWAGCVGQWKALAMPRALCTEKKKKIYIYIYIYIFIYIYKFLA
jgi:hypothetical protein